MTRPEVLQLCQDDHAPFAALCDAHALALSQAGCEVTTVFLRRARPQGDSNVSNVGAPFRYLSDDDRIDSLTQAAKRLAAQLAGRRFRLVLCHRHKPYRLALKLRRRIRIDAVIVVAHELGYFDHMRRRWQQRLFARDVDFAGVSQAVADDLARANAAIGRPLVIPNLLDTERCDRTLLTRERARRALDLPADAYLIGMVGRLHRKKTPALAADAFASALPQLPRRAMLVVIGDGAEHNALARRIDDSGLSGHVLMTGAVPEAARYMPAFDLFLFSAAPREAFGMALLEAMLARVLIVSADSPGPREVLGDSGVYYRAGDAASLTAALAEAAALAPEQAESLRARAQCRVHERFSVAATAARYRRLLARPE